MPIEKNIHYGYSGDYGGGYGSRGGSTFLDNGPPYIVKLSNIPVSSDDAFVEDLFRSRFTNFVKFKIVVDPSSNPLETGLVKKIAFVELNSFADQNRVLKWQDLFYKGSRRVVIELADFMDFKNTMEFNQKNADALAAAEQGFLSHRQRPPVAGRRNSLDPMARHEFHRGPALLHHTAPVASNGISTPVLGALTAPAKPPAPKPNPFGNAKPVDVNARLHEIEKKLITINHTTIRTAGTPIDKKKARKLKDKARERESGDRASHDAGGDAKSPSAEVHAELLPEPKPAQESKPKSDGSASEMKPAQPPPPIYDLKHSLADILSSKPDESALARSTSGTPKPKLVKPVILKKQPSVVSSPAHQLELERSRTPADEPELEAVSPANTADTSPTNNGSPENEARKEKLDKTRRRRELKSKEHSRTKDEKEKLSPPRIMERNKSFSSDDHPNFKEHLNEMTQDKLPRSASSGSRRSRLSKSRRRSRRGEGQGEDGSKGHLTGESPEKSGENSLEKPLEKAHGEKALATPETDEPKKRSPRRSRGGASRSKRTEKENGPSEMGRDPSGTSNNGEDSKPEDGRGHRGGRSSGRGRRRNPRPASSKPEVENGAQ